MRDDAAVLALLPHLLPSMQQAPDPKRVAYLVQVSQLLMERGRWKEARDLLFPLVGLDPKAEEPIENGPVVDSRVFLPPAFYRLCFGLFLCLDDTAKATELATRVERQLRKLRDRREEEKMAKERAEAKRQQLQKQREGKVTVQQLSKEEKERQASAEREEEADIRRKVAAKLDADWSRMDDNEQRLQRLRDWADNYGLQCDEACRHREEETWVKRKLDRLSFATTADDYAAQHSAALALCADMAKAHPTSGWAREQLAGMEMDLWADNKEERSVALRRSLLYFPNSFALRRALALLLCGWDEGAVQAERDRVIGEFVQQWPMSSAAFTPSLAVAHFWSRYLDAYSAARAAATSAHLTACIQSIQGHITDLTAYQGEHPLVSLSPCLVAFQLLHADVLVCRRDEGSADEATRLYSQHEEDGRLAVRRVAVYGLMKAAVLRRSMEPTTALAQVKRWREAGGADPSVVAWLSAFIHFARYEEELIYRRETVRLITRQQRRERRAKDQVLLQPLLRALTSAEASFPTQLLRGKVLWALGGSNRTDKEGAYQAFVSALSHYTATASQLSPFSLSSSLLSHADCFAYLGLYTQHVLALPLKGQLFYQKALHIQPHNAIAGPALALVLTEAEQESQLLSVFTSAIHSDSRCRWAYLLSARHHLHRGMEQQSIALYQHALRSGGKGGAVWSELGGAYFSVGSFIAALRCWKRAAELNEEDDAAIYGIAQVLLMLHMHTEAIDLLTRTLQSYHALPPVDPVDSAHSSDEDDSPVRNPPVLAVTRLLADVHYAHAVVQCNAGAYNGALQSIAASIDTARSCFPLIASSSTPSQLGGTFKVLGDAHVLYAQLPVDSVTDVVRQVTAHESSPTQKHQKLLLADRYYAKALLLHPTLASLWYDRGIVNRQLSLLELSTSSSPSSNPYAERAIVCMKQAVTLAPQNSFHWLGVATVLTSFAARHHSLVQSIRVQKNPTAWAHLSLFYLQHGGGSVTTLPPSSPSPEVTFIGDAALYSHFDAARKSLQLAQTMDPLHPAVWLAQGLFNGGFDALDVIASAAGCFARSVELGPSYDARVGLVYCSVVTQDWLTAAYHARKLTEQWPHRSASWNLHGVCCEWKGRHEEAERAFAMAEQLMAEERLPVQVSDPAEAQASEERARLLLLRLIRVNRARVLAALGRYADSIVLAQAVMQGDVELGIPSASTASLYLYHLLADVYSKGGQYEEGRRVVVAAMELITEAREEQGEDEAAVAAVRQLAAEYHSCFVEFVQLLMNEGKDDEALHHLSEKLQQGGEEGDRVEEEERRLELLRLMLRVGVKRRDSTILSYAVETLTQATSRLLDSSPPTSHARLLRSLYEATASASLARGDIEAAKRAHLKAVKVDPTFLEAWNTFLAFHLHYLPSLTSAILPLVTVPHLADLHFQRNEPSAVIERLRLLATAYLLTNRFIPATPSLSSAFEREELAHRAAEEQQLMAHVPPAEAADEAAEDDSTTLEGEVKDDDIRHDAPVVPALVRLAATASSSFVFDSASAPPSSRQAVSAAARLVLLDPTAREHWALLATAAEGRELERWRQGDDSDEGWNSVVSCSGHHSALLRQQTFTHLPPVAVPQAQEEAVTASLLALMQSVYAMSHSTDEATREERLESMQQSMASIPSDRLTTAALRWHFHRCSARLLLCQGDVAGAFSEYQRCVQLSIEASTPAKSSDAATATPSGPLPLQLSQAAIWEEVALSMESEEAAIVALRSGLTLLDQQRNAATTQQGSEVLSAQRFHDSERVTLLLALLDCHQRCGQWKEGLALLQSEATFLSSQPSASSLAMSLLLCDWMEWAASPRAEYRREVKALTAQWQEWENAVLANGAMRWEQPLPARTHWHIAQAEAEQKRWDSAAEHLREEAQLNPDISNEPTYSALLEDVLQRMRVAVS